MELEDLEQKKAMLAAIIDSSGDAIISKDLNSIITSWNKAAERMFGYSEEEAIGKNIHILIPEDRSDEEDMIIAQLKAGKRIEHFETIRVDRAGRSIPLSLTISPIKNVAGQVIGASKIARDISKQKQNEELISQYAQRLELINSVGKKIVSHLDVQTILQTVTDAATQLSGAAFGAFFYNKIDNKGEAYMLFTLSGAPREAFEKFGMPRNTDVFRMTFEGRGVMRSDDITKDPRYGRNTPHKGMPKGHLPVVSYLAVPVASHTGIVIGGLFFGHPEAGRFKEEHESLVVAIASQAAIALDNAKLYEEVRALNKKKDEFIGFASHELKTPLTTIKGYVQLAGTNEAIFNELLPKIDRQVTRLEGIVSELLDISKIHAGKLDLQFSKGTFSSLIKESVESFPAEAERIRIEMPSQDVVFTADMPKMVQVLNNLLSNALKYSPSSTSVLLTAMQLGDQLRISVADKGAGIASQDLAKIFSQFYRVTGAKRMAPGVGLGLYISKEIVEEHQGKIWADSEEGVGSVFYVSFPIERY